MEKSQYKKEIFVIPTSSGNGFIIYAPLKKCAFWVNNEYGELIKACVEENIPLPEKYEKLRKQYEILLERPSIHIIQNYENLCSQNRVVFILSQKCNLGCTYCYASKAHSGEEISWEKVSKTIAFVLENYKNCKKEFSFIGGGEPMMTWELLKKTVLYAEEQAANRGELVEFSMTTNGILLDDARAKWLAEHNFRVGVSFEILPEIQDKQRCFPDGTGSFVYVDKGIKTLLKYGIIPGFRSTITEENVQKMKDMVQFTISHYPEIKRLHFEHVSGNMLNQEQYYSDFIKNFIPAVKLAKDHGIKLKNSITHSMNYIRSVFCKGELCITPTGDIVSCHRVSSDRDSFFDTFRYGYVNEKKFNLLSDHMNLNKSYSLEAQCDTCFAQWHCAGGCAYNRLIYSRKQMEQLCKFTRNLILKSLECKFDEIK